MGACLQKGLGTTPCGSTVDAAMCASLSLHGKHTVVNSFYAHNTINNDNEYIIRRMERRGGEYGSGEETTCTRRCDGFEPHGGVNTTVFIS